jgi:hypothetical protein
LLNLLRGNRADDARGPPLRVERRVHRAALGVGGHNGGVQGNRGGDQHDVLLERAGLAQHQTGDRLGLISQQPDLKRHGASRNVRQGISAPDARVPAKRGPDDLDAGVGYPISRRVENPTDDPARWRLGKQ